MRGKWASSCGDFGYTELFSIPELTSEFISFVTVFLGTLWCSIKKIESSYLSDSELWIALHPMQGIGAYSPAKGDVSWSFASCGMNLGYILELQ